MKSFFTILYIITNKFSDEKIAIGLLANINGIPHFHFSERKLNFALLGKDPALKSRIKKSLRLMDFDINKIKRGEETLNLFDPPYAKKVLKELAYKKRGVLVYSDLFEVAGESHIPYDKLYAKFINDSVEKEMKPIKRSSVKVRFKEMIGERKFEGFHRNFKLTPGEFPYIYKEFSVDLLRKTSFYTVFFLVDFSASLNTVQNNLVKFRAIVQSLQQKSTAEGLGKGRYYLVYESTSSKDKQSLIQQIHAEVNAGFELIRLTEMKDKV